MYNNVTTSFWQGIRKFNPFPLSKSSFCRMNHFNASLVPKDFRPFRIGLVQLASTANKDETLKNTCSQISKAVQNGSKMVVLPECFNSPYGNQYFNEYAETIEETSPTYKALHSVAKELKIYVFGGSIPERKDGKLYNTSMIFNPYGNLIGIHRKIHLFDVDFPGKMTFRESESLNSGNSMTIVETEFGKIGLGICYDIRFPELATIAARNGCSMMIYPGAFNLTTGPLHWELLARARAVDNQIYVASCSPARDVSASYHAWGHSTVVGPDGVVMSTMDEKPGIVYADIDPEHMASVRKSISLYTQRRFDVYSETKPLKLNEN
ncbi:mitochondrial omega-amidase [Schizosaccharomyces osmophilus]|uniref:Mitochondrial omega-amidase n=1 Tax=Schizosaccharomyces osmophilus TaxID=2545709 RepID=A0AAE9W8C4_9SCHI|nr:mitochondrial omega-amidase [Schizosaccharomyces osmophilus]WBW71591.1 mitochondrial omega-amidase [Schizosaccharomyces osmophilus]